MTTAGNNGEEENRWLEDSWVKQRKGEEEREKRGERVFRNQMVIRDGDERRREDEGKRK